MKKGATRLVFIIKPWVVKIPRLYSWRTFLNGLLANLQEVEFSKIKDRRMCPVVFYFIGGWLLIMPYCEPISHCDFVNLDETIFHPQLKGMGDLGDRGFSIPVEIKQSSFGWYGNEIVAIDYGS